MKKGYVPDPKEAPTISCRITACTHEDMRYCGTRDNCDTNGDRMCEDILRAVIRLCRWQARVHEAHNVRQVLRRFHGAPAEPAPPTSSPRRLRDQARVSVISARTPGRRSHNTSRPLASTVERRTALRPLIGGASLVSGVRSDRGRRCRHSLGHHVRPVSVERRTVEAQTADAVQELETEVEGLREGQRVLQNELDAIKAALADPRGTERRGPFHCDTRVGRITLKGSPDAPFTVVEFSDYSVHSARGIPVKLCPKSTRIREDRQDQVRVRNFPIDSIHPDAPGPLGGATVRETRAILGDSRSPFCGQSDLKDVTTHAVALGLDVPTFETCLGRRRHSAQVRADLADGQQAGVRGTPLLIGKMEPDGRTLRVLASMRGARPFRRSRRPWTRCSTGPNLEFSCGSTAHE